MSFDKVAVQAANDIRLENIFPPTAWDLAARKTFPTNSTSIKKCCPKNPFLGLCEEGLISGINSGQYTRSELNKSYALRAVEILKRKGDCAPKDFWLEVLRSLNSNVSKPHNSQMKVVLSLWRANLII